MSKKIVLAVFIATVVLIGCDKKPENQAVVSHENQDDIQKAEKLALLNDVSGVWTDGSNLVTIYYNDGHIQFLIDDEPKMVSLGEVDTQNNTVNLLLTKSEDGQQGIWTVKKVYNVDKTAFNLNLITHIGSSENLSFVRKVGSDDKQRIANIYLQLQNQSQSQQELETTAQVAGEPLSSNSNVDTAEDTQALPASQPSEIAIDDCEKSKMDIYKRRSNAIQPTEQTVDEHEKIIQLAELAVKKTCASEKAAEISGKPSYDCAKASYFVEKTICNTPFLAGLDVKLSNAHRSARYFSTNKAEFDIKGVEWLKERAKCTDVSCIEQAYYKRINELNAQ